VSIFVDSSVWFAAAVANDRDNARAKSILQSTWNHVTTDHVLIETWLLLNSRCGRGFAERFWERIQQSAARLESVTAADLHVAWAIGLAYPDQAFSIVDRTSFAVMERLGIVQAASFDNDFAVYRFGPSRNKAFEMVRWGHSATFGLFHHAILRRQQVAFRYNGQEREVCPYVLGHTAGKERVLAYQFGGVSRRGRSAAGEWRCFNLSDVHDAAVREGPWRGGAAHRRPQRCVDAVYVDVNTEVPNQPGRRAGATGRFEA
jgi:predicted nucleic acid-binding protein